MPSRLQLAKQLILDSSGIRRNFLSSDFVVGFARIPLASEPMALEIIAKESRLKREGLKIVESVSDRIFFPRLSESPFHTLKKGPFSVAHPFRLLVNCGTRSLCKLHVISNSSRLWRVASCLALMIHQQTAFR